MRKLSEVLTKETWIKGALALNDCGKLVGPYNEYACQFCLLGALFHKEGGWSPSMGKVAKLIIHIFPPPPSVFVSRSYLDSSNVITEFNDNPFTKWADIERVINAFEEKDSLNSPAQATL